MKLMDNVFPIVAFVIIFFCLVILIILKSGLFGNERVMVSYEYTTQCRCGGIIEGYQSLVDDYNSEECKKCGYHKE